MKILRIYLALWATGAIVSAIGHLCFPQFMAGGTVWPLSLGWQHEIAIFDLVLAGYVLSGWREGGRERVALLTGLSLLLGFNHAQAGYFGRWDYLHVAGVTANALALALGLALLWRSRIAGGRRLAPQTPS